MARLQDRNFGRTRANILSRTACRYEKEGLAAPVCQRAEIGGKIAQHVRHAAQPLAVRAILFPQRIAFAFPGKGEAILRRKAYFLLLHA